MLGYKNILIFGMGITGKSAFKFLRNFDCNLYLYDQNENNIKNNIDGKIKNFKLKNLEEIDLIIKSPGINPDNKILRAAKNKKIDIFTDIELAYRYGKCKNIIAITGTNGKTTTTSLIYEILSKTNKTYCVGNIGKGILDIALLANKDDYIVLEASSFQLEDTREFRPKIALITNITSDHLDWHKTRENYITAKKKIFKNQTKDDYLILNYFDEQCKTIEADSNIKYFSICEINKDGSFLKNGKFFYNDKDRLDFIASQDKIKIIGDHNIENILAAIDVAKILGVSNEIIEKTLYEFKGVEHRLEFIKKINGVFYYNDSKATNPDSAIKAINAIGKNIILIAGGYDKNSDFHEMLFQTKSSIKSLLVFGQTADQILDTAKNLAYKNIKKVKDLKEATLYANKEAQEGDYVLLAPACASWDMYKSYEERGKEFKRIVNELI